MSVQIDCDTCVVRGLACSDCVVSVLLGPPDDVGAVAPGDVLSDDELEAFDVLASSGLVPPLRMVSPTAVPHVESA